MKQNNLKGLAQALAYAVAICATHPGMLVAQTNSQLPGRISYYLHSGTNQSVVGSTSPAYQQVVNVPGATSLRLHFGDYDLGAGSFIKVTSLKDGATQHLKAKNMADYQNSSAFFNGDAVQVELFVAPGDENVFFELKEVTASTPSKNIPRPKDLCGGDDRVRTTDPAVGRLFSPSYPTAAATCFLIMNGGLLTANHVNLSLPDLLVEFNCPSSLSDGTLQHPPPSDQYPLDHNRVARGNGPYYGGQDWALFDCLRNSETGLRPIDGQRAFYRLESAFYWPTFPPISVRVTGYGIDNTPAGSGSNGENADNCTLQTATGAMYGSIYTNEWWGGVSRGGTLVVHWVDTMAGDSGAPISRVAANGTTVAIGIHTYGACNIPGYNYNWGTGFDNTYLVDAVNLWGGQLYQTVFLDQAHPAMEETGTIWHPILTFGSAYFATDPGGTLVVAGGTYTTGMGSPATLDQRITIRAVGGPVTILY